MEREQLTKDLDALFAQTYALWAKTVNELGGLDEIVIQLSKAATAIRNTRDLAKYPKASLVDAISIVSSGTDSAIHHYHAVYSNNLPYVTLCGYKPPMDARIGLERRVPTCPGCLQVLGFTDSK